MLGTIIGDMAGTRFEYLEYQDSRQEIVDVGRRKSILNPQEQLIAPESFFSDDTILTIAIAEAILYQKEYFQVLKKYGREYSKKQNERKNFFKNAFSPTFIKWANCEADRIGDSIGNGAAMRISPIAFLKNDLESVQSEARKSAIPSHNSEEALKGAECLATAIFFARQKRTKEEIKKYITEKYHYFLDFNLEVLQQTNRFYSTCEKTVPQAIFIFLISNDFEDAIRKAISIGGDTDTVSAMVGGIAEAYYGVPDNLREQALNLLPDTMKDILEKAYTKVAENKSEK